MAKSQRKKALPKASEDWKRRVTVLFREMASDLSSVLAGKHNVIQCPLCLKDFTEADINPETLSEEHVIPKSAGGTLKTITCKSCNNHAGSEIDSVFARAFRIEDARHNGAELPVKFKTADGVGSRAFISYTQEGLNVRLASENDYVSNDLLARFEQYVRGERGLNLSILNNIDPSKLAASIVKMAYLSVFKDWGYRYILLPNRDWIRKGIRFDCEEREWLRQLAIPAVLTDKGQLPEAPTRMTFDADCNGIDVCCSIIKALPGVGSVWVTLPPMFNMTVGHHLGLHRAAESIRGKSLTVTFESQTRAIIRAKA